MILILIFGFLSVASAQLHGAIPHCPDTYGLAVTPHESFCDKFYKCENGTLTLETCENGLLFDGRGAVHNHCNYNWAVSCEEPVKRINEVPQVSTPGCPWQFGIYPKSANACHQTYIKCAFGIPYETPCEYGLAYDDRTHSCNWPDLLVDEFHCNPEEITGFRCPDKVEPDTLAYKFWPYPRFTIPGEKARLITCVNGYPRITNCEHGKLVDELSLTCLDAFGH